MCENCLYYDKLKSKLESKRLKKKVIFCNYQNKPIDIKQVKTMVQCDLYSSSKPD